MHKGPGVARDLQTDASEFRCYEKGTSNPLQPHQNLIRIFSQECFNPHPRCMTKRIRPDPAIIHMLQKAITRVIDKCADMSSCVYTHICACVNIRMSVCVFRCEAVGNGVCSQLTSADFKLCGGLPCPFANPV